jgi:HEAT repeat protein
MHMTRKRSVFGPLFYATLVFAAAFLLTLGVWRTWPTISEDWTIWSLIQQLRDSDPKIQDLAADQLAKIGSDAMPLLIRALKDRDSGVRRRSCAILGMIRPRSDATTSALIDTLGDDDSLVRCEAAEALGVDADNRRSDCAIQALRAALRDQSWVTRRAAARALGAFGSRAESTVGDLEHVTHDADPHVRAAGALALASVNPRDPRTLAALRKLIADPALKIEPFASRVVMKQSAVRTLKDGADEGAVLETVVPLLRHPDASVRLDALWCIQGFVSFSVPVLSALRESLKDGDVRVAGEAASVLIFFGGQGPDNEIIAALVASTKCPAQDQDDLDFLYRGFHALKHVAPGSEAQALPAFVASLDRVSGPARRDVVDFLGQFGPAAATAVAKLVELSKSPDPGLSAHALLALRKINPEAAEEVEGKIARAIRSRGAGVTAPN